MCSYTSGLGGISDFTLDLRKIVLRLVNLCQTQSALPYSESHRGLTGREFLYHLPCESLARKPDRFGDR